MGEPNPPRPINSSVFLGGDVIKSLNMAGISSTIEINKLQSMQDNLGQRPELMQVIYSPGKGIISVSNKTGVIKTGDTLATIYDNIDVKIRTANKVFFIISPIGFG